MWEIISTLNGHTIGHAHTLQGARNYVFAGYCFAKYQHNNTFLVHDPRNGRVATLFL